MADEWMDIESAPKDGTWVQCWGPDGYGIAKFPPNPIWAEYPEYTHWRPLPPPPPQSKGTMMSELEKRLERIKGKQFTPYENSLMDEAAAQLRRYREALEFYAKWHPQPSEGPWGAGSTDFGDIARQALQEQTP